MKLTCLVDNAVRFNSGFWGEHGLAYLVEADGQRILFDTGQSGTVLLHNLKLLGVDPLAIDALAVSHAHYDHTGGLPALLPPPVALIAGGLHLASVAGSDVRRASARLAAMPALRRVYLGHCTGEAAFLTLAQTLGSAIVQTGPAGTAIEVERAN